jgi:hypothetical protein
MRKTVFISVLLLSLLLPVFFTGCLTVAPYETSTVNIPPGGSLQTVLAVDQGEIIEGDWRAGEAISGYYIGPQGTKQTWTSSNVPHTFLVDGRFHPGKYVFTFRDTGDEGGQVTFRYRNKPDTTN